MKVTWEPNDISVGRRYSKQGIDEVWMIGYLANATDHKRYVSISLIDGCVLVPKTQPELAESLNEEKYIPVELLNLKLV